MLHKTVQLIPLNNIFYIVCKVHIFVLLQGLLTCSTYFMHQNTKALSLSVKTYTLNSDYEFLINSPDLTNQPRLISQLSKILHGFNDQRLSCGKTEKHKADQRLNRCDRNLNLVALHNGSSSAQ